MRVFVFILKSYTYAWKNIDTMCLQKRENDDSLQKKLWIATCCVYLLVIQLLRTIHDVNSLSQNQAFSKANKFFSFLYLHDSCAAWVVWLCVVLFWQSTSAKQRWPWKLTASNRRKEYGCGWLIDKSLTCSLPSAWSINNFFPLILLQGGSKWNKSLEVSR